MSSDVDVVLALLRKLRKEQRDHWRETNAILPNVLPKALGLIHGRAAADIEYAKRLVFDCFHYEDGALSRRSSPTAIIVAASTCLRLFADELDPIAPSAGDWRKLEKLAAL
jgi:hypothetical protein